ncbi:CU044_2847 family protein [Spirillospora sp. CA-253888]
MSRLVRWETEDGPVVVEVADHYPGYESVSRFDDLMDEAKVRFEDAMRTVRTASQATLRGLAGGVDRPDQIELEFSLKLNAAAGAVIAKTSVEGQMKVKLTWGRGVGQQVEVESGGDAGGSTGGDANGSPGGGEG